MSYFFFGSAKINDLGQAVQYGLFDPVTGRFVLVHADKEILRQVAKLFSSRLALRLCDLSGAENFCKDLIDNSVCLQWGLDHAMDLAPTRLLHFDRAPWPCARLQEIGSVDQDELIWLDRQYFWYTASWVMLFTVDACRIRPNDAFLQEELPVLMNINKDPVIELRDKIFSSLYRHLDFATAQLHIDQLLHEFAIEFPYYANIKELDLSIDRH